MPEQDRVESTRPITMEGTGSSVVTIYTERQMKMFNVSESELRNASLLNNLSAMFCSIGTGLIALVIGVMLDLSQDSTAQLPRAARTVCWLFGIGGAACYVFAWILRKWRASALHEILSQSRPKS